MASFTPTMAGALTFLVPSLNPTRLSRIWLLPPPLRVSLERSSKLTWKYENLTVEDMSWKETNIQVLLPSFPPCCILSVSLCPLWKLSNQLGFHIRLWVVFVFPSSNIQILLPSFPPCHILSVSLCPLWKLSNQLGFHIRLWLSICFPFFPAYLLYLYSCCPGLLTLQ